MFSCCGGVVITRWAFFVALLSGSAVCHAAIDAQDDVLNRPHPEYDQVGIRTGGFTLLPSLTSQVSITDNYRATPSDPDFDVGLLLTPDLTWRSNWSRHRVNGNIFLHQSLNAPLHEENFTSFGANANGLYDISSNSQIQITLRGARLAEDHKSLRAFRDAIKPTLYDLLSGRATYSQCLTDLNCRCPGTWSIAPTTKRCLPMESMSTNIFATFACFRLAAVRTTILATASAWSSRESMTQSDMTSARAVLVSSTGSHWTGIGRHGPRSRYIP